MTTPNPHRWCLTHRNRRLIMLVVLVKACVLLACEDFSALPTAYKPRWACPSPTPRPTTIKARIPRPTTTPGVPPGHRIVYYKVWEQEYGLPPVAPTPYTKGDRFLLGQRVEIAPLHALVKARSGPQMDGEQVQIVTIAWRNSDNTPIPMDYLNRVRVRSVRGINGAHVTSDAWTMSDRALAASGLPEPTDTIPTGDSSVDIPILTPPGHVEIVEIGFLAEPATSATPEPNAELEAGGDPFLTVQWSRGTQKPPCDDPGVYTNYGDGPQTVPTNSAPPGTARVIQIALNQVGKPYVWGAKGPNAFDCSGLTEWSYAQIGIDIPTGTSGQWPGLPAPQPGGLRTGDLLFFDTNDNGRPEITHVGLVSDLDGDGDWDMVHAASPRYGVRIDEDVFSRPYYANMYMGARTVR